MGTLALPQKRQTPVLVHPLNPPSNFDISQSLYIFETRQHCPKKPRGVWYRSATEQVVTLALSMLVGVRKTGRLIY